MIIKTPEQRAQELVYQDCYLRTVVVHGLQSEQIRMEFYNRLYNRIANEIREAVQQERGTDVALPTSES